MKELLHFTADWCQPCKKNKPIIENYIGNNPDVIWTLIDVDKDFQKARDYNVQSVPTLIVLFDGIEIKRHSGIIYLSGLIELLS